MRAPSAFLLACVVVALLAGCTQPDAAPRALTLTEYLETLPHVVFAGSVELGMNASTATLVHITTPLRTTGGTYVTNGVVVVVPVQAVTAEGRGCTALPEGLVYEYGGLQTGMGGMSGARLEPGWYHFVYEAAAGSTFRLGLDPPDADAEAATWWLPDNDPFVLGLNESIEGVTEDGMSQAVLDANGSADVWFTWASADARRDTIVPDPLPAWEHRLRIGDGCAADAAEAAGPADLSSSQLVAAARADAPPPVDVVFEAGDPDATYQTRAVARWVGLRVVTVPSDASAGHAL